MKKRVVSLLLATMMTASMVLTGCGGSGKEKPADGKANTSVVSEETEEPEEEATVEEEEIQEEGWTLTDNNLSLYFDDDQLDTFLAVTEEYQSQNLYYAPIAVLASQTVNGTNYMYLAFENNMDGNGQTFSYKIIIANNSSDGTKSVVDIKDFDVNCIKTFKVTGNPKPEQLEGGWTLNEKLSEGVFPEGEDQIFNKAMESYEEKINLRPVYAFAKKADDKEQLKFFAIVPNEKEEATKLYVVTVEKDGSDPVVSSVRALNFAGYAE